MPSTSCDGPKLNSQQALRDRVCFCSYLGVVPGLQRFSIISLTGAFGCGYQVIQAVIDHRQIRVELALTRN